MDFDPTVRESLFKHEWSIGDTILSWFFLRPTSCDDRPCNSLCGTLALSPSLNHSALSSDGSLFKFFLLWVLLHLR